MKKIFYILPAAALLLSSCGDFLDEKSQSEVIPKTADDYSELLIGNGYPDTNSPSISFLGLMEDDCEGLVNEETDVWDQASMSYIHQNNFAGESGAVTPMPYYTWQPYEEDYNGYNTQINTTASSTTYGQFYSKIMGCNAVLDGIDDANGTQGQRDRVKAEALAVRALLYFQLVNIYGEPYNYNKDALGVPLKLNADLSTDGIPRSTVSQVYDQILSDLTEAANLMDPLDINHADYHINQPAIHILLSRVYLFMERYQDCIDECNKALKMGIRLANLPVELQNTYTSASSNPYSYNNPEVQWVFGPSTRPDVSQYKDGTCTGFLSLWNEYAAAQKGTPMTTADKDYDMRWDEFNLYSTYATNGGVISISPGSTLSQAVRTAEAYLNKMEAEALLGNDADALSDLNTFCATRYANYTQRQLSGQALLDDIRLERRKEFFLQGFRWFDLRRQGMPQISHIYRIEKSGPNVYFVLKHNDPMYTVPIPRSAFEYNTQLVQNPCRDGEDRQPQDALPQ